MDVRSAPMFMKLAKLQQANFSLSPTRVTSRVNTWNEMNYPQFVPGNTLQGSYWNAKIVLKSVRFSTCGLSWLSDVFLGTIALPT